MSELVEFLRARIAEDEERFGPEPWLDPCGDQEEYAAEAGNRVLRECEVKRRIIEENSDCTWGCGGKPNCHECMTLATIASVYAAHPDYHEEWKP